MTTIVREFSPCGPCIPRGRLVKTTAKFYCYEEPRSLKVKRVLIRTETQYSPAHIEPCASCEDHKRTMYPHGYMD